MNGLMAQGLGLFAFLKQRSERKGGLLLISDWRIDNQYLNDRVVKGPDGHGEPGRTQKATVPRRSRAEVLVLQAVRREVSGDNRLPDLKTVWRILD